MLNHPFLVVGVHFEQLSHRYRNRSVTSAFDFPRLTFVISRKSLHKTHRKKRSGFIFRGIVLRKATKKRQSIPVPFLLQNKRQLRAPDCQLYSCSIMIAAAKRLDKPMTRLYRAAARFFTHRNILRNPNCCRPIDTVLSPQCSDRVVCITGIEAFYTHASNRRW